MGDQPIAVSDMTRGPYAVHYKTPFLFRKVDGHWQRRPARGRDQRWRILYIDQELLTAQKANMTFDSTAAWKWL